MVNQLWNRRLYYLLNERCQLSRLCAQVQPSWQQAQYEGPFASRYFNPRIGVFTANHRRFGSGIASRQIEPRTNR